MRISDINPYLRFAAAMRYEQVYNNKPVKVSDCRIFFVTESSAQLRIGDHCYTLLPDSLFYCCAGSEYTTKPQSGFSLISLNFDLDQSHREQTIPISPCTETQQWPTLPVFFHTVEDSPFLNNHLFLPNAGDLYHHLEAIVSEFPEDAWLFREMRSATLKTLLTEMHRKSQDQLPQKVLFVRDYIQKHFAENITNRDLADLVGYHEYYLNRIFAEHMGSNLHSYLLKIRLNRASFLILNTNLELGAIPELVGFRSYPHFSSYFKQAYGYSPAEYRKRLKGSI